MECQGPCRPEAPCFGCRSNERLQLGPKPGVIYGNGHGPKPPIAGAADTERESKLDASRVTLEFGSKSTKRLDSGRFPISHSPLFGGNPQENLF